MSSPPQQERSSSDVSYTTTEINGPFKYSDLLRQLNFTHDIFILAKDMSAPQLPAPVS